MKIEKELSGVKKNILLKDFTTFKIGGKAKYFFVAKTKNEIMKAVQLAEKNKLPFFILSGGSNLLVSDKGFNGLVIKIQNTKYKIVNNKVTTEAGVMLSQLVGATASASLTGLEWAAGIPGALGGAIRGNAGAFGKSIKDSVESVEVYDSSNGKIKILKNKNCHFDYRESIFKKNKKLLVISAVLKLRKYDEEKIKKEIQNNLDYRKKHHPTEPSAGSIFKNIKLDSIEQNFFKKFPKAKKVIKENSLPAAFLIAQCDLMGKKIGGAMVSERHPNFIVNFKGAKTKDVLDLINLVKEKVKDKFNLKLEEEIELL